MQAIEYNLFKTFEGKYDVGRHVTYNVFSERSRGMIPGKGWKDNTKSINVVIFILRSTGRVLINSGNRLLKIA